MRYAFIDLADDIAFWMVVGFLVAGVIVAVVPDDLVSGLGAGPFAMLFLLLISVPLNIRASASTPIAAALIAKGVSPGAALVFLLAGPATNMATIFLLTKLFGRRFISVYLTAIVTASLACGLALDGLLAVLGWDINVIGATQQSGSAGALEWLSALVLLSVLAWRLTLGAARQGVAELKANVERSAALPRKPPKPLSGVAGSGLHIKYPWPIDLVIRLDRRTLLFDNEPIEMLHAGQEERAGRQLCLLEDRRRAQVHTDGQNSDRG